MWAMQVGALVWLATAAGGLTMAWMRVAGRPRPPGWLAGGHGAGAVAGLALVAWSAAWRFAGQDVLQNVALGLGVLTAAGGLTLLLGFHLRAKPLPMPIVIAHGILGAVTVVVALVAGFADTELGPRYP